MLRDPLVLRRRHELGFNSRLDDLDGSLELAGESPNFGVIQRRSVCRRVHTGQLLQGVSKLVNGEGQLLKVLHLYRKENHG